MKQPKRPRCRNWSLYLGVLALHLLSIAVLFHGLPMGGGITYPALLLTIALGSLSLSLSIGATWRGEQGRTLSWCGTMPGFVASCTLAFWL